MAAPSRGEPEGGIQGQDGHTGGLELASQALIAALTMQEAESKPAPITEEGCLHPSPCPCDAISPSLHGSCQGKRNLRHLPRTRNSPPVAQHLPLYGKRTKSCLKPPTTRPQRASDMSMATGPRRATATQNLGALRIRSCPRI